MGPRPLRLRHRLPHLLLRGQKALALRPLFGIVLPGSDIGKEWSSPSSLTPPAPLNIYASAGALRRSANEVAFQALEGMTALPGRLNPQLKASAILPHPQSQGPPLDLLLPARMMPGLSL